MTRKRCTYVSLLCVVIISYVAFYTIAGMFHELSVEIVKPDCNFTKFQEELRLDSYTPSIPVHLLSKCRHAFYNRIPKSASRTMSAVLDQLAKRHNFKHVFIEGKPGRTFEGKYRTKYLGLLERAQGEFVLTGHIYYVNFHKIYKDTDVYINVVREPAEWFESWFSFHKYGSIDTGPPPDYSPFIKMDISDCIYSTMCRNGLYVNQSAIHFLCGQDQLCYNPSSEAALQQAKWHLDNDYLAVGTLQQLPEYLQLLEFLMPQMFLNATDIFRNIGKSSSAKTKTMHKDTPGAKAMKFLKSHMEFEDQLYNYAEERFQKMVDVKRLLLGRFPDWQTKVKAWSRHYWRVFSMKNVHSR